MSSGPRRRLYLGGQTGLFRRQQVYLVDEGIECDLYESFSVRRRRIFFRDMLLLTLHRQDGFDARTILVGVFGTGVLVVAMLLLASGDQRIASLFVAGIALPFLGYFLLRGFTKLDVLTVYGPLTRASMHFWLQQPRARQLFADLSSAARQEQQR